MPSVCFVWSNFPGNERWWCCMGWVYFVFGCRCVTICGMHTHARLARRQEKGLCISEMGSKSVSFLLDMLILLFCLSHYHLRNH